MMSESNRKRNDVEISAEILKVARNEVRKSHLVYRTNLNFKLIDKYLEILNKNDLIKGPSDKKTFKTTEKGLKYLSHVEGFQQYMTKSDN
ncbi:MAG: 45 protein [Thermoproteota archaeon]|nr:45 protein [Thermoproteota archaeon]